jgi:hypothetical protein
LNSACARLLSVIGPISALIIELIVALIIQLNIELNIELCATTRRLLGFFSCSKEGEMNRTQKERCGKVPRSPMARACMAE